MQDVKTHLNSTDQYADGKPQQHKKCLLNAIRIYQSKMVQSAKAVLEEASKVQDADKKETSFIPTMPSHHKINIKFFVLILRHSIAKPSALSLDPHNLYYSDNILRSKTDATQEFQKTYAAHLQLNDLTRSLNGHPDYHLRDQKDVNKIYTAILFLSILPKDTEKVIVDVAHGRLKYGKTFFLLLASLTNFSLSSSQLPLFPQTWKQRSGLFWQSY